MKQERLMIIGCHALDYLSKSGGAIAQCMKNGGTVKVVCLTCGERGEANAIWKEGDRVTEAYVRERKRSEAQRAASILGADIEFMDFRDHCLEMTQDKVMAISELIREFAPTVFLTHFMTDQANPDHMVAGRMALSALACVCEGELYQESQLTRPQIFLFEPAKPDMEKFNPDTYIDITEVMDQKKQAMACVETQKYLIPVCEERDTYRGTLIRLLTGNREIQYAEGFLRVTPYIGKSLS